MTNIEKILFDTKFSIKYMNGEYYLSGFNHTKTIRIQEDEILNILDNNLVNMNELEWEDFVDDFLEGE